MEPEARSWNKEEEAQKNTPPLLLEERGHTDQRRRMTRIPKQERGSMKEEKKGKLRWKRKAEGL